MGHALFDAELLRFAAGVPVPQLGDGEERGADDEDDGRVAAGAGSPRV